MLVARPGIRSVKQLKGKTIGVELGFVAHLLVLKALEENGMQESDVTRKNITTHETGLAHYDFAKFEKVLREGIKPDGSKLDPFMPIKDIKHMDDVEMKDLWEFLQSLEKKPFGGR